MIPLVLKRPRLRDDRPQTILMDFLARLSGKQHVAAVWETELAEFAKME